MGAYALGISPMLHFLVDFVLLNALQTREVAFADDLTVTRKLTDLENFWDKLATIGPKYGYFAKSTKSYLMVKKNCLNNAKTMFADTSINITTSGEKHYGTVAGGDTYKVHSVEDLANDWTTHLKLLSTIAENYPRQLTWHL